MGHVIGIVGKSGAGKSTGAKTLNPDTTMYINCDCKPLPFKGWRNDYNTEKGNYIETSKQALIIKIIKAISSGKNDKGVDVSHIQRIIVDTGNAIN